MRYLALLLIAGALAAADVKQLAANEDLPFCRVVLRRDGVDTPHDGWYCAQTRHLYPASPKADVFDNGPIPEDFTIVSVTPAARAPGRMPVEFRARLNEYIAKNRPQVPDATAAASTPAPAAKP